VKVIVSYETLQLLDTLPFVATPLISPLLIPAIPPTAL
jgi:hypothetical protein